jgi:hypothetical protein
VKSWKKQLLAEGPTVFGQNMAQQLRERAARETELYDQIGRLKMELELGAVLRLSQDDRPAQ